MSKPVPALALKSPCLANGGKERYAGWSCACDYAFTRETFDVVPLCALPQLPASSTTPEVLSKLSRDYRYIAERQGMKLPLLPVVEPEEKKLFSRLMSQGYPKSDLVDMAETWNTHVNGTTIFPKIAAQLRVYRQQWEKGQQIKTALATTAPGVAKLQGLLQSSAEAVEVPAAQMPTEITEPPSQIPATSQHPSESAAAGNHAGSQDVRGVLHPQLAIVAGLSMEVSTVPKKGIRKRRHGERGPDKNPGKRKKRPPHKCKLCRKYRDGKAALACRGRGGARYCDHFAPDGTPVGHSESE